MNDGMGGLARDIQSLFDLGVHGFHTDGQLLGRFVDHGEAEALGALVHRHGPMVWGVCRRVLRDDHDAEDAFQATFLVLVRRAAAVVPREKVGVWLHGVARRTALKARADRARRRWRERPMPTIPVPGGTREEPADDRLLELDRELGRLPEKYRAPIVLCELEGMTHQQAAEQLRWPVGTLSGRLSRGRALLAHRLSRREPMSSLGPLGVMFAREMASARVPSSLLASTIKAMTSGVASPASVAGLITPGAAALSKGVIKHMMLTRMKSVAIAAALALGLFGIAGSVVVIGQDNRGPGRAAPASVAVHPQEPAARVKVPHSIERPPALVEAEAALARKGYEAAFRSLHQTQRQGDVLIVLGKPEEVYRWSIRRLQAERDLSPQVADRRVALESHLKRMIELDKVIERLNKEMVPDTEKNESEWYVLEARRWIEEAKAK